MESTKDQELTNALAQAEAAMSPQEKEAREYIKRQDDILGVLYLKKVREVALEGFRHGFQIKIRQHHTNDNGTKRKTEKNILTGEEEEVYIFRSKDKEWKSFPWYKQSLTTKDHNDFIQYRYKWLREKTFGDQALAEDMENRLYEFGAKKFFGMDHDVYEAADKEELRLAIDACTQITAWNGQFLTKKDFDAALLDKVAEEQGATFSPQPEEEINIRSRPSAGVMTRHEDDSYSLQVGEDIEFNE